MRAHHWFVSNTRGFTRRLLVTSRMLYTNYLTTTTTMTGCNSYKRPCTLCADRHTRVVAVCIQDNYNVLNSVRELKHIFIKHNPYSYLLMCQFCLMKLRLFVKCEGPDFTPDIYHRMQDYPLHTKDTASTTDTRHIEDTSCQCEHCKAKFGNLPLLAEVVEKIDKRTSPPQQPHETEPENLSLKPNPPISVIQCSDEPENLSLKHSATLSSSEASVIVGEVPSVVQCLDTVTTLRNRPYKRANSAKGSVSVLSKVKRTTSSSPVVDVYIPESVSTAEDSPSTSTARAESVIHRRVMNCEHCGKSFTHKGDLNKHLRKHTGEQPFECPVCQRKFAHTSNLARHLRVHSGAKPFHCDRCNKSFSRKDKLIMHQKTKLCINSTPTTASHSSKS